MGTIANKKHPFSSQRAGLIEAEQGNLHRKIHFSVLNSQGEKAKAIGFGDNT